MFRNYRRSSSYQRVNRYARQRACSIEQLERRDMLATFPLSNAGFESPELSVENGWYASVDGWTINGSVGTTYEVPWAETSPAAEGDQYVFGDSVGWSISQNGPVIASNTRYILTLDVYPLSSGPSQASVLLREASTSSVLGGGSTTPSTNPFINDLSLLDGKWTTIRVGFNSSAFPANVGDTLEVRIGGTRIAIDNVRLDVEQGPREFYFSSSTGSNAFDGLTEQSPLQSFDQLAAYLPLLPGEHILLKSGDVFGDELNIRGKGEEGNLARLGSYGTGPNPVIRRQDLTSDIGVVWNNASYVHISNIDVEHAKLGVYLRYEYTDMGSRNVTIEDSNFRDLTDPTLDPSIHNFEFAWSDAIFVGGQAWQDAEFATRLENLTIRNVTSENAAHLFGTAWYFPGVYRSRLRNLIIEDSVAINNLAGAFQLFNVDGGHIKRVRSVGGGGQDTWSGTTLGFMQSSQNFLIEDNEFSLIDRAQSADGSGMDFEGDTHNVTFRNNVIHNNAGSAILILSTSGPNTNLIIEDNTFYNNARDPWNSEINSEIQGSDDDHTGVIRNNGIYRGSSSINFLSPNSDWSGFDISGNRELEFEDVRTRETWWDFNLDDDFEGWGEFNHWSNAGVSNGTLTGQSSNADPYVHSPPTWWDTSDATYVWVRMSQTAGSNAQVFYLTDSDPVWDAQKSTFFDITADGQMRDYFVDLGNLESTNGVFTQIRLDPTIEAGSDMAIDFIRLTNSNNANQSPPPAIPPAPQTATFVSVASEDGYIRETSQNGSAGGLVSSTESTFRLGDDSSNRAYRPFLSFDTSTLPDNAIVTQATIGITRDGNITGAIPIGVPNSAYGDILVDLATPGFGDAALAPDDWQAPATQQAVSKFAWPAYLDGMTIFSRLDEASIQYVDTVDNTQFRIRYVNDDNGDASADYVRYGAGDHPDPTMRPTLVVEYFVPSNLEGDYDLNGVVDDRDYNTWKAHFGAQAGLGLLADGNGDGVVNLGDYSVWRDNLGASQPVTLQSLAASTVAPDNVIAISVPYPMMSLNTELAADSEDSMPQFTASQSSDIAAKSAENSDLLLHAYTSDNQEATPISEVIVTKSSKAISDEPTPEIEEAFAILSAGWIS